MECIKQYKFFLYCYKMSDIINEPIIWVCVALFTFLISAIIKATYCDTIISDNKSDCTAELSENGSEENI